MQSIIWQDNKRDPRSDVLDVSCRAIVSCVWFSIASSCATRVVQEGNHCLIPWGFRVPI